MRDHLLATRLWLAIGFLVSAAVPVFAQIGHPAAAAERSGQARSSGLVRRVTIEDAVQLALEQNLGIQIQRINPRIQDLAIAQTRASWAPTLQSNTSNISANQPVTNVFAGSQDKVTDSTFQTSFGISQQLPTGANYSVSWDSSRAKSSNFFNTFDPQLRSNVEFNITQPLLRDVRIDAVRQQLETNEKLRELSDVDLRATITQTVRGVRNAYWDLVATIDNLDAQQRSLELAQRLLADNEKRVQIGTMAPIDIVEAQAEVARNEEAVIVAEAAIEQAKDNLRALIFDPSMPDFWTVGIEPADAAPFQAQAVDLEAAVAYALENRSDIVQAKNGLDRTDISVRYLQNQILPAVNATLSYGLTGLGGTQFVPVDFGAITDSTFGRDVLSQRGFGSVIGDVFSNSYPTWSLGVQIQYPLGTSASEASLARARLEHSQTRTQIRNLELQAVAEVRNTARQVQTNQKRIDSARAARELAERRLEAEEKKFAAGIQTSFFVFQAQRDLAQARTNEVRAILDYNKSQVDFEAAQEVPLR